MRRQLEDLSLVVCVVIGVAVALTAVAASAGSRPVRTYVGLTDWQRAQPKGTTMAYSLKPAKIQVSSRGIETIELHGDCGGYSHHSLTTLAPPVPVRNGAFSVTQPRNKIRGRVTERKITGTWSYFACATKFVLTAQSSAGP